MFLSVAIGIFWKYQPDGITPLPKILQWLPFELRINPKSLTPVGSCPILLFYLSSIPLSSLPTTLQAHWLCCYTGTPSTLLPQELSICEFLCQVHNSPLFTEWISSKLQCPSVPSREAFQNHVTWNSLPILSTVTSFLINACDRLEYCLVSICSPLPADTRLVRVTCVGKWAFANVIWAEALTVFRWPGLPSWSPTTGHEKNLSKVPPDQGG